MNPAQFHSHINRALKQAKQAGWQTSRSSYQSPCSQLNKTIRAWDLLVGEPGRQLKRHWEVDGQEKELGHRKAHGALRKHQSRLGWCLFCEVMFGEVNNKGKPQERDRAGKQSRLQACCSKQSRGSSCLESHLSLKPSWGKNFSPLWKSLKLF